MKNVNVLILGAGPAGLAFAHRMKQLGEQSILILEKEKEAGGLCRSQQVDGSALDIGGGHFLDTRRPKVNSFLFAFMPEDKWNVFERNSKIDLHGRLIDHPLEANIFEMDTDDQVQYLVSIAKAGCNSGERMPTKFVDWIYWKLGTRIAEDYMLPYNQKMFAENLNELGTYWLEKLPNVSFEDTLRSCIDKKPYGTEPGHSTFYYPKAGGYGQLWQAMAQQLGEKIQYGVDVKSLDFENNIVNGEYCAKKIVVTIPWVELKQYIGMPESVVEKVKRLRYTSVCVQYHADNLHTDAQWIYCPDPKTSYHRILNRKMFCTGSRGYWTETNAIRQPATAANDDGCFMNQYAYPLNTTDKPQAIQEVLNWSKVHQVYGLGRWGEWEHFNSDVVVERAIKLAEEVFSGEK